MGKPIFSAAISIHLTGAYKDAREIFAYCAV
jgi:hypothetical protein